MVQSISKPTQKEVAHADKLLARLKEQRVVLVAVECSNNLSGQPQQLQVNITAETKTDKDSLGIVSVVNFSLRAFDGEPSADVEKAPFELTAQFQLQCVASSLSGILKSHCDSFSAIYGVPTVWPYCGELVSSITGRMSIAPVRLPIFDRRVFTDSEQQAAGTPKRKKSTAGTKRKQAAKKV